MEMLYLKTRPTPLRRFRWRPSSLALCLLVVAAALVRHDAHALPLSSSALSSIRLNHPLLQETAATTTTAVANIAATQQPNGVVVDWPSVCQHLCGSQLGGSGCGSHCSGEAATADVGAEWPWLGNHVLTGCPLLCSLRLGDSRCGCDPILTDDIFDVDPPAQAAVCQLGCSTSNPLRGCPVCPPVVADIENDEHGVQIGNNAPVLDGKDVETVGGLTTTDGSATAGGSEPTDEPSSPEPTEEPPTSTTTEKMEVTPTPTPATTTSAIIITTTTTMKPTTIIITTTQKTTTTPDWSELCQNLCRIGEGGALCNCDLPPFF